MRANLWLVFEIRNGTGISQRDNGKLSVFMVAELQPLGVCGRARQTNVTFSLGSKSAQSNFQMTICHKMRMFVALDRWMSDANPAVQRHPFRRLVYTPESVNARNRAAAASI